jgi:hypothetical protein
MNVKNTSAIITIRPFQNGFERFMWLTVYGSKSATSAGIDFCGCITFLHDVIFCDKNEASGLGTFSRGTGSPLRKTKSEDHIEAFTAD